MLQHRLVAHRGFQRQYPENSLLAMAKAVAAGARFVETDIQFTQDRQPVLYHDPYLNRISGREGNIADLSLAQVLSIPASEPFRFGDKFQHESVASLADFVDFLQQQPQVTAFVEIKEEAIAGLGIADAFALVEALLKPLAERAVLISFDVDFIRHAREQGYPQVGIVIKSWTQVDAADTAAIAPDYIFTNVKHIPANEDLNRFASIVVVYEIDDPAQAIALFNRGADMVETFDIGGMISALAAQSY